MWCCFFSFSFFLFFCFFFVFFYLQCRQRAAGSRQASSVHDHVVVVVVQVFSQGIVARTQHTYILHLLVLQIIPLRGIIILQNLLNHRVVEKVVSQKLTGRLSVATRLILGQSSRRRPHRLLLVLNLPQPIVERQRADRRQRTIHVANLPIVGQIVQLVENTSHLHPPRTQPAWEKSLLGKARPTAGAIRAVHPHNCIARVAVQVRGLVTHAELNLRLNVLSSKLLRLAASWTLRHDSLAFEDFLR